MTYPRPIPRSAADPALNLLKRHILPIALGLAIAVRVAMPVVVERVADQPAPDAPATTLVSLSTIEQQDDVALIPCHLTDAPAIACMPCSFSPDPAPASAPASVVPTSMVPPNSLIERIAQFIPMIAAKIAESVRADAYDLIDETAPSAEPIAAIN